MPAIQRVLFPVDLSLHVQTLSATTRRMIDRPDVEVVMLHAIEKSAPSGLGMEVARAMGQMEFLAHRTFVHTRVIRRAERGRAADCILNYAQDHAMDMIVMPAGGTESLRRNTLGHVTGEVLATAPCPVWMEWMTGSVECARHICCAVGLDDADAAVLSRAAEIAEEFNAQLTIIHAMPSQPPMALWWDTDAVEQDLSMARFQVGELRQRFAPAARTHVEAGNSDTVVSRVLHRLNAGLLVSGGHGPSLAAAAMACPVLRLSTPLAQPAKAFSRTA